MKKEPTIQVDPAKLRAKESALKELLSAHSHSCVQIHVDTRRTGVVVPEQLRNQPHVMFELGLNMPVPIRDIRIDAEGWSATMSFGRRPSACFFPWPSVYLMMGKDTGIGAQWPSDVPPEIAKRYAEAALAAEKQKTAPLPHREEKPSRSLPKGWKVIAGGKKDAPGNPGESGPKAS